MSLFGADPCWPSDSSTVAVSETFFPAGGTFFLAGRVLDRSSFFGAAAGGSEGGGGAAAGGGVLATGGAAAGGAGAAGAGAGGAAGCPDDVAWPAGA